MTLRLAEVQHAYAIDDRMNPVKKVLVNAIQSTLRPLGFEKDGSVWFRQRNGILALAALDQSPFALMFNIRIGLHVRELAQAGERKSKKGVPPVALGSWHIYALLEPENKELRDSLDGRKEVADDERTKVVQQALNSTAVPLFESFTSRAQIRELLITNPELGLVTRKLRDWAFALDPLPPSQ